MHSTQINIYYASACVNNDDFFVFFSSSPRQPLILKAFCLLPHPYKLVPCSKIIIIQLSYNPPLLLENFLHSCLSF